MSFWKDKRVFITGISGFIGGNLAEFLLGQGSEVIGLERDYGPRTFLRFQKIESDIRLVRGDLCDIALLERVFTEHPIDICFHLAAQVEVGVGLKSPYTTFESNVRGTYSLLESLRSHAQSLQAAILASTDKAYGEYPASAMPYRESYELRPRYPYDTSKACADLIAQSYAGDLYKIPLVITRFCNIYGPGQLNFSALIPDAIRGALELGTFVPRGDGSHIRDFIYVGDVVQLYAKIAESLCHDPLQFRGRIYNAGTNQPRTVREVVEQVFTEAGNQKDLHLVLAQMRKNRTVGEISTQYMDFDLVQKDFGWSPTTTFRDGIQKTFSWYESFLRGRS
jgi:CDP-glucose 4,6-dehydratase